MLSYVAFSKKKKKYGNKFLKNKTFTFKGGKIWSREKYSTARPVSLLPSFAVPSSFHSLYRLAPLPRENGATLGGLGFLPYIR